ncbi:MAG: hypothetical protein J0L70_11070 [Leptolyngbya sp. UWPOB_LEPTO1]|uniref:hypothetical protein n=1 Tax=Leptolyngbya sp. UWPOB_LEPTO1 TaxID=2815653 RepID=UPI001AC21ACE|nr:hypothetical protein [Leptolyngbya sp. UWPOB_LEPTO1]MBN8561057.1 hypothetical protein [Leptolyngbya sp. UWPOB_LEPTO1]
MNFVEEIDYLIFKGIVEGNALSTLYDLLRSHQEGLTSAEDMQGEIDSLRLKFYQKVMHIASDEQLT